MIDYPEALVERVANAVGTNPGLGLRTNKNAELPYEIVDTNDECRVISSWRDINEARAQFDYAVKVRKARAALDASGLREAVEALSIILSYAEAQPPNAFTQIHQHARAARARIKGEPHA